MPRLAWLHSEIRSRCGGGSVGNLDGCRLGPPVSTNKEANVRRKTIKVRYANATVKVGNGAAYSLTRHLDALSPKPQERWAVHHINDYGYQIRDFRKIGNTYMGFLCKRAAEGVDYVDPLDEPHVFEVEEGGAVIQKSYFIIRPRGDAPFSYTHNKNVGGVKVFSDYLQQALGVVVDVSELVNRDALDRLEDAKVLSLNFRSVVHSRGDKPGSFEADYLRSLNLGPGSVEVNYKADKGKWLSVDKVKEMAAKAIGGGLAKKFTVNIDGGADPISLFDISYSDPISVNGGHSGRSEDVFAAMEDAHARRFGGRS